MTRTLDHAMRLTSQTMCKRIPIHRAWHPASTQNMLPTIITLMSTSHTSSSKAMSHCFPMCQVKGLASILSWDLCPGFILAYSLPTFLPEVGAQAPRLSGEPQVFRGADCNSLHLGAHVTGIGAHWRNSSDALFLEATNPGNHRAPGFWGYILTETVTSPWLSRGKPQARSRVYLKDTSCGQSTPSCYDNPHVLQFLGCRGFSATLVGLLQR